MLSAATSQRGLAWAILDGMNGRTTRDRFRGCRVSRGAVAVRSTESGAVAACVDEWRDSDHCIDNK